MVKSKRKRKREKKLYCQGRQVIVEPSLQGIEMNHQARHLTWDTQAPEGDTGNFDSFFFSISLRDLSLTRLTSAENPQPFL